MQIKEGGKMITYLEELVKKAPEGIKNDVVVQSIARQLLKLIDKAPENIKPNIKSFIGRCEKLEELQEFLMASGNANRYLDNSFGVSSKGKLQQITRKSEGIEPSE